MNIEVIYYGAFALGGIWTGYLVGQFGGVKEMNRRLNALVADKKQIAYERDCWKLGAEVRSEMYAELQTENDRLSDLVATLQTKVPARNARGKFVAR